MSWRWVADLTPGADPAELAAAGMEVGERDRREFASQAEAEAWLTECFADLADAGVRAVTLYEEDRAVYGPMPLSA